MLDIRNAYLIIVFMGFLMNIIILIIMLLNIKMKTGMSVWEVVFMQMQLWIALFITLLPLKQEM